MEKLKTIRESMHLSKSYVSKYLGMSEEEYEKLKTLFLEKNLL